MGKHCNTSVLGLRLCIAGIFLVLINSRSMTTKKYWIGGWTTDAPDIFLFKFRPLFEAYLNEMVGSVMQPPVEFSLIPAEYTEEDSFENLSSFGMLDFACTYRDAKLPSQNRKQQAVAF